MSDRIYVGYLPLTPRDRLFVRAGLVVLLAAVATLAFAAGRDQRSPGAGHWDVENRTTITGVIRTDGAARIVTLHENQARTWFLVRPGKVGAGSFLTEFEGLTVTVDGFALTRGDARMLELAGAPAPAQPTGAGPTSGRGPPAEPASFRGEIVDLKCYLGAMKPGDGRAHKACATLCVVGGIPAAFITAGADGSVRCLLLRTADGRALPMNLIDRIGEPVEVRGRVAREGDFEWLIVEADAVRRAGAADRWLALTSAVCTAGPTHAAPSR